MTVTQKCTFTLAGVDRRLERWPGHRRSQAQFPVKVMCLGAGPTPGPCGRQPANVPLTWLFLSPALPSPSTLSKNQREKHPPVRLKQETPVCALRSSLIKSGATMLCALHQLRVIKKTDVHRPPRARRRGTGERRRQPPPHLGRGIDQGHPALSKYVSAINSTWVRAGLAGLPAPTCHTSVRALSSRLGFAL